MNNSSPSSDDRKAVLWINVKYWRLERSVEDDAQYDQHAMFGVQECNNGIVNQIQLEFIQ